MVTNVQSDNKIEIWLLEEEGLNDAGMLIVTAETTSSAVLQFVYSSRKNSSHMTFMLYFSSSRERLHPLN